MNWKNFILQTLALMVIYGSFMFFLDNAKGRTATLSQIFLNYFLTPIAISIGIEIINACFRPSDE